MKTKKLPQSQSFTIKITKAHANKARGYYDNEHCLLATAARAKFGELFSYATSDTVRVNGVVYETSVRSANRIVRAYNDNDRAIVVKPFTVKFERL